MKNLTKVCLSFILTIPALAFSTEWTSKTIEIPNNLPIGKTLANETIYLGGFSGLTFSHQKRNTVYFWTLTDRGPNAKPFIFEKNGPSTRPFLLPDYQLKLVQLAYNTKNKKISVRKQINLTKPDGKALTGLPNLKSNKTHLHELPTNLQGKTLNLDPYSLDSEGIAIDAKGHFWLVDEYGPSISEFSKKGKMLAKYVPKDTAYEGKHIHAVLPKITQYRKKNRGFEGVSIQGDKLYAVLQSPLPTPAGHPIKHSDVIRIIEFDLKIRKTTGQYIYLMDNSKKADKIGGMTTLGNNEFLLIERDGKQSKKAIKKIYRIKLSPDKNLMLKWKDISPKSYVSLYLERSNKKGVQKFDAIDKTLFLDLKDYQLNQLTTKYEGIAYNKKSNSVYLINDNDFGITGIFNPENGKLDKGTQQFKSFLIEIKK